MAPDEEIAAALANLHERHRGSQHFPVGLPAFVAPPKQLDDGPDDDDEIAAWCESAACRKVMALLGRSTLRPLLVVSMLFFFQNWAAATAVRPYAVEVCDKLGMPIDSHWATVATGATGIVGNVLCMVAVRWTGKRPLVLVSLALGAICCVLLAGYAQARTALQVGEELPVGNWVPLLLFVVMYLASSLGIVPIPWMLLSEIFPYRTRGLAAGIAAALSYVWAFLATKTYLDMESALTLYGSFYLYAAISVVGCLFTYFFMTETEGRSLEDIERHYSRPIDGALSEARQPPPVLKKPRASITSETSVTNANGCPLHLTRRDSGHGESPAEVRSDDSDNKRQHTSPTSTNDDKISDKKQDNFQPTAHNHSDVVSENPGGGTHPKPNVDGTTLYASKPENDTNGTVQLNKESSTTPVDNSSNEDVSKKQHNITDEETSASDQSQHREADKNMNSDSSKPSSGVLSKEIAQESSQCNGHYKAVTAASGKTENEQSSTNV